MKRIAALAIVPPALARFHTDPEVDQTWDSLRDAPAYQELRAALVERQHGLCAYCEIALLPDDTSVEHIVPRSDPTRGSQLACDPANMLAICRGGGNVAVYGPAVRQPDPSRVLPPVDKNLSCGQAKGNLPAEHFLDPRQVPEVPSVARVDAGGNMVAVPNACLEHGIAPAKVEVHINRLGLRVERLRIGREAVWSGLTEAFSVFAVFPPELRDQYLAMLAEAQLLPDGSGMLKPFFTTSRSFFGPLAETILDRPPRSWI